MQRFVCFAVLLSWSLAVGGWSGSLSGEEITRVWLTHRTNTPSHLVVSWMSSEPGDSVVKFGPAADQLETIRIQGKRTLHHVEIPLVEQDKLYHYQVRTGTQESALATFKGYPTDVLRVAVVADWQGQPDLSALMQDDPHLLLTAGDNISQFWRLCEEGQKDCVEPYARLVDAYPALFRSIPFMPAQGNHDREIRPRGSQPPEEPVYDLEATAARKFFALPDQGWKWSFSVPNFQVQFVALDFHHISDFGTTWQSCQPFDADSAQFRWYRKLLTERQPHLVTLYNERNASIRGQVQGAWHEMFRQGTCCITGFGHYAERAEVDGFPYYNTSLQGRGNQYPDPHSRFLAGADNYLLLTFLQDGALRVEIKSLTGKVLDRQEYQTPVVD